ncbi:LmeA family phospholipid-binding protein [Leptolyngbya sp. AN02str]|uniref:LmeA family phospholipid-binding protein n=1 Tax=Leptolyngbya sp. AN02str TaxID=3423363 RepID=UPI003D3125D9
MTHQPSQFSPQPSDSDYSEYPEYQSPVAEPQMGTVLPDPDRNLPVPRQSHIISSILSPAVRLWLRSQTEHVETLDVLIEGGDRQLLAGLVPRVTIAARNVVYQGLYLNQVRLVGRGIQVNFRQILRGKPLRLAQAVTVQGDVALTEDDLNDSLQSPLLANAISDFLVSLLREGAAPELVDPTAKKPIILDNFQARIDAGRITLVADIISATQGTATPFAIRTGLRVYNGQELRLDKPEWLPTPTAKRGFSLDDLDGFPLELGTDVDIRELVLHDGGLTCRGQIRIVPEEPDPDR